LLKVFKTMKDRITQLFLQYLKSCNVSEKTLRYYKSDLALFTAWLVFKIKSLGADCENLQEALPFLTNKTAEEYKEFLIKNGNSVQTINRRLSTLRILSKFLLDTNLLSFNFAKNIKNISKAVMVPPLERAAAEFSNYLEAQKASFLTRKNYLADINQFLRFIEKQSKKDLQEITSKDIKRYLIIELASSPETTKDRKISSLKKFFSWAKEEKKTNINPVEDYLKDTAYLKPIEKSLSEITEPSINRKVFGNYPSYEGLKARINAYLAGKPRLQKLVYHILYTRPKWYKAYHSLAISRYLNFAILVIFATGLGFGVYQQLFAKPQTPIAYPSQPVPPKRYLSFQGRLTNQYQTPITTPTNIVFKLYDASTGGNTLWNSAGVACSVDPDEDGIFSILLGTTSGDGYTCTGISPIDSSVFTENAEVWLGIKVGSDPEATPRIQIATVAYALNAETLQGYPIDATGSATKNTVLTMNSGGEVVLAEVGPKIKSVSGNFSVQGEAVTIQANGGGVAGDITLSPASDGTVSILASGTTNDSLYIQNAQITSGALIHGYYGGTSTTVDLLKLGAGATESTKFLVESSGDTFIASGADLFIGGIGLNDNSSNSSGASLIGLYDDNMTYISGNTNVQSAIKQLDTAIGTLTGSAGGWTDDGTIVRLTTSSDRVGIGTTSVNSNTKVGILGNLAIGSQTYSDAQAPTNGLIVEGNVGIGTTAPTAKLDVAGDILVNNGGSIDTRAAGTLTIGGTTQTGLTVGRSGATTTINGSSVVINSLSGIIQGSSGTISAITGTANYVPRWSSSAPYLTSTSTIFDNGTNVGIGTTVPTKGKLNVLGSVAIGSTAYTETSGAAPTNGLIVEGNVGIGTASPSTFKLEVAGSVGPSADNTYDLGSSGRRWANIYGTNIYGNITPTGFTQGSVIFAGAGGTLSQNNANFFWDNTNLRLGIGTNTPSVSIDSTGSLRLTAGTFQIGNAANVAYNRIGTNATNRGLSAASDLLINGKLEVDQAFFPDSGIYGSGGSLVVNFPNNDAWFSDEIWVDGKIGIGTTAPANKLSVIGGVNIGSTSYNVTAPTNGMIVEGNVGIGTTSPAQKLQVNGNIYSLNYGSKFIQESTTANNNYSETILTPWGQGAQWAINAAYTGSGSPPSNMIYKVDPGTYNTGAGLFRFDGNGKIWEFYVAPTSTGAGNPVSFTRLSHLSNSAIWFSPTGTSSHFYINSSGNVGIGTTAPASKFHLMWSDAGATGQRFSDAAIFENNGNAFLQLIGSAAGEKSINFAKPTNGADGAIKYNFSSVPNGFSFWTNGNNFRMAIDQNGNVGIGTAGPGAKLSITTTGTELSGTAASATLKTMAGNLGTTAGNTLKLASFGFLSSNNSSLGIEALRTANGTDWTTTAIGLKMDVDNTSPVNNAQIWLTSTGNVGIGTTSPRAKLHVRYQGNTNPTGPTGTWAAWVENTQDNSGYNGLMVANRWGTSASTIFEVASYWNGSSEVYTPALTVKGDRNVGIGTTNPGAKLDITDNYGSNYIQRIRNSYNGTNRRQLVIYQGGTSTPATSDIYIAFSNDVNWGFNGSVSGNGSGGVQYNTTSDKRLKTNLQTVTNALDIINNITPYYFDFIFAPGKTNIGFMAQDIMNIYPYAVSGDPNDDPITNPMQVDYSKFTPLLLAGIQQQQTQIEDIKDNVVNLNQDLSLTATGDINIVKTQADNYQIQRADGSIVSRLAAFAETVIGKIRAGSISAYEITTNGFIAFQAQVDNLLVKTGLVSPSVQTAMISPLADEKDIVIRLGKSATGSDSVQGKLSIQNQNGEEVASINSEGDATFSGTLNSENLAVENNATISGDLTANNINTGEIRAEKLVVDQIVSPSGYNSGITLEQIEELLRQAQADQNLLGQAEDWYNATSSAQIKNLAAETATLKNLFVTQSIAANSLSLSQSISLGTDMVIQSQLIDNKLANSIDTLTAPLSIQSLALAPVEIMAGKIRIETNGDVYIAGNLYVAGRVESTGLTVKTSADMTRTDLVRVEDEAGNLAAGISASGSAQFKELASDKIVIAGASVATDSATLQNGEINTNASAGSGILPAGQKEIAIVSPNIKSESLVYVTPTSDTKNYVLYVKAKEDGRMVVGFNRALDIDVYFNWWVIEAR